MSRHVLRNGKDIHKWDDSFFSILPSCPWAGFSDSVHWLINTSFTLSVVWPRPSSLALGIQHSRPSPSRIRKRTPLPAYSQLAERFLQRTRDCTLRDVVQAKVFHRGRDGIRLCPSASPRSAVNFTRASTCLSVGVLEQKFEERSRDPFRSCTMLDHFIPQNSFLWVLFVKYRCLLQCKVKQYK